MERARRRGAHTSPWTVFRSMSTACPSPVDGDAWARCTTALTVTAAACSALSLFYVTTLTQLKVTCLLFGVSPSTLSRYLNIGMVALNAALQTIPAAAVVWPSAEKQEEFTGLIRTRYPRLQPGFQPFGFVDGLNLPVRESSDYFEQNANYNGWLAGCYVSSIFVYGPDGTVIWARCNMPGSWHDAHCARGLFEAILETPGFVRDGMCIVGDTAFPRTAEMRGHIVTPKRQDEMDRLFLDGATEQELVALKVAHNDATTVRQAAEWGMRQLQSGFARLRLPLPLKPESRRLILDTCVLLHNLRVRKVGLSQIRTVYSPIWQKSTHVMLEKPKAYRPSHLSF